MTGYRNVNLKTLIQEIGEDNAKAILSNFSCPLNQDVEDFLRIKAIDFAKQGWAQTHLVFASYKNEWQLVGYYTLADKHITIKSVFYHRTSQTLRRRLNKFANYDPTAKAHFLTAPLIAQLGKNYTNGYDKLITGDELLQEACRKISKIQYDLGGRFAYVECEDKPPLIDFYSRNGFVEFDRRDLDKDEVGLEGGYLVQLLKYIHSWK